MITAFTSEYMQESPDGCQISQTYLSLISCLQYIQDLNINEDSVRNSTEYIDLNDYDNPQNVTQRGDSRSSVYNSNILDQSMTGAGISNLIKDTTRR